MKYRMKCPAPGCNDIYTVEAKNDEEAVGKFFKKATPPRDQMPPMTDEEIKEVMKKAMKRINASD